MEITKQVAELLEENKQKTASDSKIAQVQRFYQEMEQLGLAPKSGYKIPPLDTTGMEVYKVIHKQK